MSKTINIHKKKTLLLCRRGRPSLSLFHKKNTEKLLVNPFIVTLWVIVEEPNRLFHRGKTRWSLLMKLTQKPELSWWWWSVPSSRNVTSSSGSFIELPTSSTIINTALFCWWKTLFPNKALTCVSSLNHERVPM